MYESWSAWLVRIYNWFGLPNPIFSTREIVVLCMRESEIPYLRLRSHQELWSRSWHGWFLKQRFWFRRCSITQFYSKSISCFQRELKARWGAACFVRMKARLSRMILHSASAVDVNLDIGISQRPTKHGFSGVPVRFLIVGKKGVFG